MSTAGAKQLVLMKTGGFYESPEQRAAHGPCPLCAAVDGGLAHGRVCPKLQDRWNVHHAIVLAIAGFVAGTKLASAQVEVPIAPGVRADARLVNPQGLVKTVEVKTIVKACKQWRGQSAASAFAAKERLACEQYAGVPSCLGKLVPVVIDTCSLRINEQGAQLLRELQADRDTFGAVCPSDECGIQAVVIAAAAEALASVDREYRGRCKAAAYRAAEAGARAGNAGAAGEGAQNVEAAEGAANSEATSEGDGAHIEEGPQGADGHPSCAGSPAPPHPQRNFQGGLAGGIQRVVGERAVNHSQRNYSRVVGAGSAVGARGGARPGGAR